VSHPRQFRDYSITRPFTRVSPGLLCFPLCKTNATDEESPPGASLAPSLFETRLVQFPFVEGAPVRPEMLILQAHLFLQIIFTVVEKVEGCFLISSTYEVASSTNSLWKKL